MGDADSDSNPLELVYLPPEILLIILILVNPSDIWNLRQTCRTLHKISDERVVWLSKLQEQATHLPLPSEILRDREINDHLLTYPVAAIESTVIKAQRTAEAWTRPRLRKPIKLGKASDGSTLMGLKLLLDKWLVAVYFEGVVHIYDARSHRSSTTRQCDPTKPDSREATPVLRASLDLETNAWTSCAVSIDPEGHRFILALSHSRPPYKIHIYQIELLDLSAEQPIINKAFYLIRIITLPHYKTIQVLDVAERLIIVSTPGVFEVLKWDEDYDIAVLNRRGARFDVNADDVEGLWNGIVAVKRMGSHILVHKTRSLEIHPYDSHTHPNHKPLKHAFALTFREVSFSDCSTSTCMLSETVTHELSTFAYDVIQGLFQYIIRLSVPFSPASELPLALDVQLAGVYPLALGVVQPIASSCSAPHTQRPPALPNFSPSPSFSHAHITRNLSADTSTAAATASAFGNDVWRRGGAGATDYSSRGFLSTHSIGPQGKRGIWVERKRTSTVRDLQVWSRKPPLRKAFPSSSSATTDANTDTNANSNSVCVLSGPGDGGFPVSVTEMERNVVYTLHSYDLRDDITCSTFGELSGTIVLGHRSGDISIVTLEY